MIKNIFLLSSSRCLLLPVGYCGRSSRCLPWVQEAAEQASILIHINNLIWSFLNNPGQLPIVSVSSLWCIIEGFLMCWVIRSTLLFRCFTLFYELLSTVRVFFSIVIGKTDNLSLWICRDHLCWCVDGTVSMDNFKFGRILILGKKAKVLLYNLFFQLSSSYM